MTDNTPTHEHRRQRDLLLYGTHFDLVDDGLALCLDATKVLQEVRITDEMIERAAREYGNSSFGQMPVTASGRKMAERMLRAALEVEHD